MRAWFLEWDIEERYADDGGVTRRLLFEYQPPPVTGEASSGAPPGPASGTGPSPARNLAAARILLAATALWVVLSRHDLPSILAFPPEMWAGVSPERRLRFLMVFGLGVERALYALLARDPRLARCVGLRPRAACFLSGVLLYHFAPFETIIRTPNPYLRGLTIPTLGLLVAVLLRAAGTRSALWPRPAERPRRRRGTTAGRCGWCRSSSARSISSPAGPSSSRPAGLGRRRRTCAATCSSSTRPWWRRRSVVGLRAGAASAGVLRAGLGWGWPSSSRSRWCSSPAPRGWVLLPAAAVFHVANSVLFRIFFQNVPLLLLFVDWDALARWRRRAT